MKYLILVGLVAAAFGCASIDKALSGAGAMPAPETRPAIAEKLPGLTPDQKAKFVKGEVWMGMSDEQLLAHFGNEPQKRQKKLSDKGDQELRLYAVRVGSMQTGIVTKYFKVTMTSGKLSEFQELERFTGNLDFY